MSYTVQAKMTPTAEPRRTSGLTRLQAHMLARSLIERGAAEVLVLWDAVRRPAVA
jgi:hypothetical protein